ncbi:MAG: glycosyltransferase family 39 protein, partial [Armatimonadota bacterium]
SEVGPRLPSILCTVALYAIVAWFARRRFDAMTAVLSLFVLGSSLLVVVTGRMLMADAPLNLFFCTAMLTYWESIIGDPRWKIVSAACLGVSVLAKGPVAIILFLLIAGWTAFANRGSRIADRGSALTEQLARESSLQPQRHRDTELNRESWATAVVLWLIGTVILFAIVGSWYVPAYLANGHDFVQKFLIEQNVGRFTGGDQAHTLTFWKSFWVYIPVLLVGMFPWVFWLPGAWPRGTRPDVALSRSSGIPLTRENSELSEGTELALRKFLAAWALIVFLFFTISGAKLPHYILPMCVPVALLVANHLAGKWKALDREAIRPKLFLTVGWLCVTWIVVQFGSEFWYVKSGQQDAHALARWIAARESHEPVLAYKLSRLDKDRGTGKAELQETSLPSLSFYMNQDILEDKKPDPLIGAPSGWIFTRPGRITEQDIQAWAAYPTLLKVEPLENGLHYVAYHTEALQPLSR